MQEPRRHSHIDANPVSLDLYASKPSTFAIPTHANSCQFTAVLDPCSVATLSPPTLSPLVTLPAMPDTGTERDGSESDRTRRIAEAAHSHTMTASLVETEHDSSNEPVMIADSDFCTMLVRNWCAVPRGLVMESRDSSRKLSHHQRNKRKSQLKRQTRRLSLNLDVSRCSTNLGQPTPNSPLAVRSVRNCLQKSGNWKRRSPEIGSGAKMMASIGLSIAEQSGLVVDDWRAASPKTMRTITQSMTSFPLPNVPEITLTSQRDGTVVDEWLEAQIEKMVELIGRTGFFRARELVFAADCKGSVSC
ncbi:hypothetical protein BLNAU_19541 [Blattamonas nauphoetae]|uniref:Uncharacterized protein n=1 Tax=Blattamonas nauphoetae TaxID=2049346 RepID=A0ABQ9X1R6_9EUKA|nr:hypothetical protein BLNAU_19541 [Blattamonas nauphoetae]